jgi:hypothetical protein
MPFLGGRFIFVKTNYEMKTILIPTDFTSASLQLIEETILFLQPEPVNIVLFHAFEMPQSMQDVVGVENKPHLQVMNERFRKGCKRIKNKYSASVSNIHYRHMYGNTVSVFKHYLQFNKIDCIVYPSTLTMQTVHPRSIHPDKLIKKSGCQVITSVVDENPLNLSVSRVNKNGDLLTPSLLSNS